MPHTELKTPKTEVTPVGEQNIVDKGQQMTTVDSSSTSPADHSTSSSHPANWYKVPRSVAAEKSAPAVMAMSNQIWWPCQESDDEEETNDDDDDDDNGSSDNDDPADNNDDATATDADAAADANNNDTAKVMSWTEIDASFEESIRELDSFLLQHDSDPL